MAIVTTDGPPSDAHARTYELICSHWVEIWGEVRRVLSELMESYHHERPDWKLVNCVYIHVPIEPMAEAAEWSIGIVFSSDSTLWSLPFEGWSACPREAQAIY